MKLYYFVDKEGQRQGPLPLNELKACDITPKTLVWCKGMEKWARAKDVDDFSQILSQEAEPAETIDAKPAETIDAKPAEFHGAKEPADAPATKSWGTMKICAAIAAGLVVIGIGASLFGGKESKEPTIDDYLEQAEAAVESEEITGTTVRLSPTSASGKCDHDGKVYYEAKNLIDGNTKTCWALDIHDRSAYTPQGFGGIKVSLSCQRLDHIILYNGYQKTARTFSGNPRAKTIAIYNADDLSQPILSSSLDDTSAPQTVYAVHNALNRRISKLLIFFPDDFYYPAEWNDLSLSEIEFYGVE